MMSKGVLLFCFDTETSRYHRILRRCVRLIRKNLKLPITVVTDIDTFHKIGDVGHVNYKLTTPEQGNKKDGKPWLNVDRHLAYDLSPYDTTLVMDIDYFPFTDNLRQFLDTGYDFLVSRQAHDLMVTDQPPRDRFSMIDMVWATILIFNRSPKSKMIFDAVKYVKKHYSHFMQLYRITARNFRNDYAFAIALQQMNGFVDYEVLPIKLPTLMPECEILKIDDNGLAWRHDNKVMYTVEQDVHVLNKGVANV